jgi:hypothetical protein
MTLIWPDTLELAAFPALAPQVQLATVIAAIRDVIQTIFLPLLSAIICPPPEHVHT